MFDTENINKIHIQISKMKLTENTINSILSAYNQLKNNNIHACIDNFISKNKQSNVLIHYYCSECNNEACSMLFTFNKKLVYGCKKCNAKLINRITKTSLYLQHKKEDNLSHGIYTKTSLDTFKEKRLFELKNELEAKGLKLESSFIKAKTHHYFNISCKLNHISKIKGYKCPDDFFCQQCFPNVSYGEEALRRIVESYYHVEFKKVRPDWLKGKQNNLELDCYNDDLKIAFEFNGITHYKPIYGMKRFKIQCENDLIKQRKCVENGVKLYVIKDLINNELARKDNSHVLTNIISQLNFFNIDVKNIENIPKTILPNKLKDIESILKQNNKQLIRVMASEAHFSKSKFLVKCIACNHEYSLTGGTIQNNAKKKTFCCKNCSRSVNLHERFEDDLLKVNRKLVYIENLDLEVIKRKLHVKCLNCNNNYIMPGSSLYTYKIKNKMPECPTCKEINIPVKINNALKTQNKELVEIIKKHSFVNNTVFSVKCLNCKTISKLLGSTILKGINITKSCKSCTKK